MPPPSRPFWPIPLNPQSAVRHLLCTALQSCWLPRSDPWSAAGLPITSVGAGSSLSTYPSRSCLSSSPISTSKTRRARKRKPRSYAATRVPSITFALTALCFGSLEVVLDKGQEDDWFGSPFIATCIATCIIALLVLLAWEILQARRGRKPVIDLSLFKNLTFSISF